MQDVNNRLKNYCTQTNLDYIENNNIKEEHLGNKKLHLNKKGNTVFANKLLKYLRAAFLELEVEYKSKTLNESSIHSSFSTLKSIWRKSLTLNVPIPDKVKKLKKCENENLTQFLFQYSFQKWTSL